MELAAEIAPEEDPLGADGVEEFACNARDLIATDYEGNWATFPD